MTFMTTNFYNKNKIKTKTFIRSGPKQIAFFNNHKTNFSNRKSTGQVTNNIRFLFNTTHHTSD